ncbi:MULTISPECIES: RdgB/HAM1 family non-canonical purine NTP pyrophosphatase [Dactylosporangium]|uniref:dITP/XTP pyrophosphatase n=2 Tax=Dactylosporangium TaxID=35753 RepID=A0A9W6KER4_9ACTN|nr:MULTISPECIES: RdgB/HAM1 family non-canonical purine NTP pyrophosphatase [Dactylosporangium]UAB95676.1 RdgB/HAM1 family non-canonical purine NTP pyrophosphatase [Dactylosporangium vinaceum]UWZ44032.1 RdgB/HAM1 family non-canonical purine NTP pyrophosphatase [Dactylosporangium matsuzakiense]GLL00721.1 non-canonical purine NTP pyrophosphatase [Dactylosporangium matsuzakiense]
MNLLLATRNKKKLVELRRILEVSAPEVTLLGLDDVDTYPESPETGLTFEENALLKAREAVQFTGLPSIADDSGIAVNALNGMPGVFSARWSGLPSGAPDRDGANLRLVLAQVADVPDEHLGAAFVCVAALVHPDGREQVFRGEMPGRLIRTPRGDGGFGYDPIFVADGYTQTTAELTAEEKDAISHRGKAFRALAAAL